MKIKTCIYDARDEAGLRVLAAYVCGRVGLERLVRFDIPMDYATFLSKLCGSIAVETGKRCMWDNRVSATENPFGEIYTIYFDEPTLDGTEELRADMQRYLDSLQRYQVQNCHCCENMSCGDNMSNVKTRLKKLDSLTRFRFDEFGPLVRWDDVKAVLES